MGLRNFTSAPRNVAALPKTSTLSIASQSPQRRHISERTDGRGKIYEFEDVRPRQQQRCTTLWMLHKRIALTHTRSSPSSKTPPTHAS
jgi:hypothetical protein